MESKQTNSEEKQIDKTKGSLKRKAAEMREMAEKLGLQWDEDDELDFEDDLLSEIDEVYTDDDLEGSFLDSISSHHHHHHHSHNHFQFKNLQNSLKLLQEENDKKGALIENMRRDYLIQIAHLEERVKVLQSDKELAEKRARTEVQDANTKVKAMEEKLALEMASLRAKQQEVEAIAPILRERAEEIKVELQDLLISEAQYMELKAIPEEKYTIKEVVQIRAFEMNQRHKQEKELLQKTIDQLNEKIVTMEKRQRNNELSLRDYSEREESLARENKTLQLKNAKLESELVEKITLMEELKAKVENTEQLKARIQKLESELSYSNNERMLKTAQLQQVSEEREELLKRVNEEIQKAELLKMDKLYLSKESESYKTKSQHLQERLERKKRKMSEIKKNREDLYTQLVNIREEQKKINQDTVQAEIEKMRNQNAMELEQIRANMKEVFERENRSIRESRDNALAELDRTKVKLAENKHAYNQLLDEHRHLQASSDTKIQELNSEIKRKSFEMERTMIAYEEMNSNLKQANIMIDQQRKKIDVLTSEYYNLKTETTRKITELESSLAEKEEKLSAFESLEKDLDAALLSVGQDLAIEDAVVNNKDNLLTLTALSSTNTSKRRIRQTLQLSRKVMELQKVSQELGKYLEAERHRNQQLTEELRQTNELLNKTQQPYNYLIENLRDKDKIIEQQKHAILALENEIRKLRQERELLENQLHETRNQQLKIEQLKALIERLQARLADKKRDESIFVSAPLEESQALYTPRQDMSSSFVKIGDNNLSMNMNTSKAPLWFQKLKGVR